MKTANWQGFCHTTDRTGKFLLLFLRQHRLHFRRDARGHRVSENGSQSMPSSPTCWRAATYHLRKRAFPQTTNVNKRDHRVRSDLHMRQEGSLMETWRFRKHHVSIRGREKHEEREHLPRDVGTCTMVGRASSTPSLLTHDKRQSKVSVIPTTTIRTCNPNQIVLRRTFIQKT